MDVVSCARSTGSSYQSVVPRVSATWVSRFVRGAVPVVLAGSSPHEVTDPDELTTSFTVADPALA